MARLTYTTPLFLVGIFASTACPQSPSPSDTEGTSTGESTDTPDLTSSTTAPEPTTVDPDTSTTAPDPDTSTGAPVCEPDCGPDECCVGGHCFDQPDPVCNPGCGLFEACQCPEGSDPCTCIGECVGCGTDTGSYDPCFDVECPDGSFCVVDDPLLPTLAWCAQQGCGTDDCACPLPAEGATAVPRCGVFEGDDGGGSCFLDCSADEAVCPEGMTCRTMEGSPACVWEQLITPPGYGDCVDNPLSTCQPGEDTCLMDAGGTAGACSLSGCADAGDCLDPPLTGDAPVTCDDLGAGNTCFLDCAGGQTCPDGSACTDMGGGQSACLWTEDGFVLDEDFEQAAFRPGWTLIDVDGNTPAEATEFVTDAWVVSDTSASNYAAYSTSWYAPAGQSDDWMVTPQITLGPASVLSWVAVATDPGYRDGSEVYVSTMGATVMAFMASPPVFAVDEEETVFTPHMVDLAAAGYADVDVYIAFRNESDDDNLLVVDDVQVTQ